MAGSVFAGSWWGIGCMWFLQPSQPYNVLMMSIYLFFVGVGAILPWFCYLPAVLAILLPVGGTFAGLLFLRGEPVNVAVGLIIILMVVNGAFGSMKLAHMLNHALRLNFENAALRLESEEKSLLLETALENMGQGIS